MDLHRGEIEARIAKLTGNERALIEAAAGREHETETLQEPWLVALGDARRSDTDRAIVERVKQAGAGNALWEPVSRAVENLERSLERVRASPAEASETAGRPGR